jgi:hypothetical protein
MSERKRAIVSVLFTQPAGSDRVLRSYMVIHDVTNPRRAVRVPYDWTGGMDSKVGLNKTVSVEKKWLERAITCMRAVHPDWTIHAPDVDGLPAERALGEGETILAAAAKTSSRLMRVRLLALDADGVPVALVSNMARRPGAGPREDATVGIDQDVWKSHVCRAAIRHAEETKQVVVVHGDMSTVERV